MRVCSVFLLLAVLGGCAHRTSGYVGVQHTGKAVTSPYPVASDARLEVVANLVEGSAEWEHALRATFFGIPVAPLSLELNDPGPGVVFVLDQSKSMNKNLRRTELPPGKDFDSRDGFLSAIGKTFEALGNRATAPTKLEKAKEELIKAVRALPEGTQFNVIFFGDEITAKAEGLVMANAKTRADVEAYVSGIRPGGTTAAVPALRVAYLTGARRVVLLSDGLANTGGDGRVLLDEARGAMYYGKVRFDTVGLGVGRDVELLQALAKESGGIAVVP
jgi:hypothetical protein